jgi:hypothetical protein
MELFQQSRTFGHLFLCEWAVAHSFQWPADEWLCSCVVEDKRNCKPLQSRSPSIALLSHVTGKLYRPKRYCIDILGRLLRSDDWPMQMIRWPDGLTCILLLLCLLHVALEYCISFYLSGNFQCIVTGNRFNQTVGKS